MLVCVCARALVRTCLYASVGGVTGGKKRRIIFMLFPFFQMYNTIIIIIQAYIAHTMLPSLCA